MSKPQAHNQDKHSAQADRREAMRSLRTSKLLWFAVALTLISGGAWVWAAATQPAPAAPRSSADGPAPAGFAATGEPTAPPEQPEPRLIDRISPTTARMGGSFVAGFLLMWGLRRFMKMTLLFAIVVGAGLYVLSRTGVFDLDYAAIQSQVDRGVDWAHAQTGAMKDRIVQYIPSGGSALLGMFFGARR